MSILDHFGPETHRNTRFSLDRVQFSFPAPITTAAIANNILIVALRKPALAVLRIHLMQPDRVKGFLLLILEISCPFRVLRDRILHIYICPSTSHAIFTCASGDNYYLHSSWDVPRNLTKLRVLQF